MSTEDMPLPVFKRLGYSIKRAQHALRVAMDEVLRPLAITTPQYAVLSAVEAENGLSNARLARAAFVTAPTMQGILANLERDGLLVRHAVPGRGPALECELTAAGRALVAQAHEVVAVIERTMLDALGEDEAIRLAAALVECADHLAASRR